ncbi:MAG: RNA binding S1 domain protein [Synergistales bacterium 53_16]|jgi:S1 RNA binding domain protein|nr:MAG: RNA binding S1 domain protein [Synergistales bacterium 53_16]KUL01361.1 MAG: RNA binding S1 domain protein [Synergistales bacterium 54_9]MDK2846240.1 binding domain protein [Synergistales bacterium]MDN5335514.1 binding domain protein [Synergistales bacterium]HAG22140.1 RNA-binding protein [Synergistaceae bacterium]
MEQQNNSRQATVNVGDIVTGTVEQIMPFGAFVRLSTGQKAMVHISELSHDFVKKVEDVVSLKQEIRAKVVKIDEKGRIDLSIKKLQPKPDRPRPQRDAGGGDDFEKKLASFLKASDQKISDLNKKAKDSRGSRGRGKK